MLVEEQTVKAMQLDEILKTLKAHKLFSNIGHFEQAMQSIQDQVQVLEKAMGADREPLDGKTNT